jgi:hypothetical protein
LAKKSLKGILLPSQSASISQSDLSDHCDTVSSVEKELDPELFQKFVDEVLIKSFQNPPVPLPQNIDESMKDCLKTYLQEYVHAQLAWQVNDRKS